VNSVDKRTIDRSAAETQQDMAQGEDKRGTASLLAQQVSHDANAVEVADATAAIWQAVEVALAPIIGSRGVAALYQRSVFLTGPTHAWLAPLHHGMDGHIDLAALKRLFAQQSSTDAIAGGKALLQTFHRLLTSLVGTSLTERLLHSVWSDPDTTPSAQDAPP
jgi:hypothetical protein